MGDVPVVDKGFGGHKICGGATCGFSEAKTSTRDAKESSASTRKLWMAVVLCIIFMGVEVAGGINANSLAILTDAAHLLLDVAAFAISLFSLWASGWEANPRQSYGFFRIEIIGALVSIQMIWLLAGILVYEAITRIIHMQHERGHDEHNHGHSHEDVDNVHNQGVSIRTHHHDDFHHQTHEAVHSERCLGVILNKRRNETLMYRGHIFMFLGIPSEVLR